VVEPPDLTSLDGAAKDALILALIGRINVLIAEVETLKAENAVLRKRVADLEAELGRPPKTPDNSSMPPSRGHKASEGQSRKPKSQAHGGAHRPLHPNPTHRREVVAERCPHCRADVAGVAQSAVHAYDRIEIPEIRPEVTRVTLYGGRCACCARRFKAAPPAGLEPGSPFGPNLRAFVLYLRFTQAISFERLARLLSDLLGLEISEGALVNMLDDSRAAFARQTSLIRQRLLAGTVLQSDETSVRVGKQTWWTWVFHDADSACFLIRPSRGKAVVEEFLADHRPAFWVSDRLAAQMGWATQDHQVCLAFCCARPNTPSRPATTPSPRPHAACSPTPAPSGSAAPASPTPPCAPMPPSSSAGSTPCCASPRAASRVPGCNASSRRSAATSSSSSPTAPSPPPTTAPSRRCVRASSSARSPTASDPNGPPTSMPTSDPSSKPPAAAPSPRSTPSA
jgi:transposase